MFIILAFAIVLTCGCSSPRAELPDAALGDRPDAALGVRNGRVACASDEGTSRSEITSYAADGSDPQRLRGASAYPAWSRDGSQIWFSSFSNGSTEIWTMAPDGSNPRQVSTFGGDVVTPAPSPDGRSVAFAGVKPGGDHPEIWIMNMDGTNLRQLTTTTGRGVSRTGKTIYQSVRPSWSPDGKKLVWASSQSGRMEVWTMNADGSEPRQLTFDGGDRYPDSNVPEFSLDGTSITFWSGYETEYGEVWVMDPDGGNRRHVTDTAGQRNSDNPTWAPDGKSVLFISTPLPVAPPQSAMLVSASGGEPRLFAAEQTSFCAWQPIR